jgi:hypothetical protein
LTIAVDPSSSLPHLSFHGDQRTVFRGVDWHTYHSWSEATGEGQHVRLTYDGKDLEIIMVTGNLHEHLKELINKIVNAVTLGDLRPRSRARRGR